MRSEGTQAGRRTWLASAAQSMEAGRNSTKGSCRLLIVAHITFISLGSSVKARCTSWYT